MSAQKRNLAAKQKVNQAKKKLNAAQEKAQKEVKKVKAEMDKAVKKVDGYVKKNPHKASLISAGVGAAIGATLAVLLKGKKGGKNKK